MTSDRFNWIAARYQQLRIGIIGDFCLDRYLEIDPALQEISIETDLPVHNVVRVRSQPGGAGTILNNLCALGIGQTFAAGFCGEDGEGWELRRALDLRHVCLDHFITTQERNTFTYTKPLLMHPVRPPIELNRLDIKNWSPTPGSVIERLEHSLQTLADQVDALVLLDQVDREDTGVVTAKLLQTIAAIAECKPALPIIADSRRSLAAFPNIIFKMNSSELARLTQQPESANLETIRQHAVSLARRQGKPVFITMAERGMIGAVRTGESYHVPALPVRGEIDIVGAGDAVTANLTSALASGAAVPEAMTMAMAAASVVIHQLGTTGTASLDQIGGLLFP